MALATTALALTGLGAIFEAALAARTIWQKWEMSTEVVEAVGKLIGAGGNLAKTASDHRPLPPRLMALHMGLATRAFATACRLHWFGDTAMWPGSKPMPWLLKPFVKLSSKQEEVEKRRVAIHAAMERARARLTRPLDLEERSPLERFDVITALLNDPLCSPWYRALWDEFTNPEHVGNDAPLCLIDRDDKGARLKFERLYRQAHAEAMASPAGAEVGRGLLELGDERAHILRELLVSEVSTWKWQHVFGAAGYPGVPSMPLGEIYVEPDGLVVRGSAGVTVGERAPVKALIQDLLTEHKIVIVCGDFGEGKSLTARSLACAWAERYLTEKNTASPDVIYPVFIRCRVDFANHDPSFTSAVRRALRNQARAQKFELLLEDRALDPPKGGQNAVYLLDGLDEVAFTGDEMSTFFRHLDDCTGTGHRAVVFSRRGGLPELQALGGIPVIAMQPLRKAEEMVERGLLEEEVPEADPARSQIAEWLEKWNKLSGMPALTVEQLHKRGLLNIVTTPMLLFLAAVTWEAAAEDGNPETRAAMYGRFFEQIAAGKYRPDAQGPADQDENNRVVAASQEVLRILRDRKEIEPAQGGEPAWKAASHAMLWLMARLAWARHCRQDPETDTVTEVLETELGLTRGSDKEETVRRGVLLVLQADHPGGTQRILFGHRSFREFLVASYWSHQLRRLVTSRTAEITHWDERERTLMRARLLTMGALRQGAGDGCFAFLREMLNSPEWAEDGPKLRAWANDCFNREEPAFPGKDAHRWTEDQSSVLREAALAIGSALPESKGLKAARVTTLRTLLAGFWVKSARAILIAQHLVAPGSKLQDTNLCWAQLKGADLTGADLQNADISRATLDGAQLTEADLRGANLSYAFLGGASLVKAQLDEANLQGALLEQAQLDDASLVRANLRGAQLDNASLRKTNLTQATLTNATLVNANLAGASLSLAHLDEANLRRADLSAASLDGAQLSAAILKQANLTGARLEGAVLNQADFEGATLARACLVKANLNRTSFIKADLTGTDFGNADLSHATFIDVDLAGANLVGAIFDKTYLSRVHHDETTTWPDGYKPPPSIQVSGVARSTQAS